MVGVHTVGAVPGYRDDIPQLVLLAYTRLVRAMGVEDPMTGSCTGVVVQVLGVLAVLGLVPFVVLAALISQVVAVLVFKFVMVDIAIAIWESVS